jgi:hypothetical protein
MPPVAAKKFFLISHPPCQRKKPHLEEGLRHSFHSFRDPLGGRLQSKTTLRQPKPPAGVIFFVINSHLANKFAVELPTKKNHSYEWFR